MIDLNFPAEFLNYIALRNSDKIINADLAYYNDKTPILRVSIKRRNYSEIGWGFLGTVGHQDFMEILLSKEIEAWTPIDCEAGRAIMCAIKCFDKLSTESQNEGYYEDFALGYVIPSTAKFVDEAQLNYPVMKSDKEYREDGTTDHIDTEEHVRAAISYFAKSDNYNKYKPAERTSIAKRILSAAKRFEIEVSEEWKDNLIKKSIQNLQIIIEAMKKKGYDKEVILKTLLPVVERQALKEDVLKRVFVGHTPILEAQNWVMPTNYGRNQ